MLRSLRSVDWSCQVTWRRARRNTARCLVGCTLGDLSAFQLLMQAPVDVSMPVAMGVSMASGIATSMALETVALKYTEKFSSWRDASRAALRMSLISMLAMELTENTVCLMVTGGVASPATVEFWVGLALSSFAGFCVPLPYNYYQLKKYGRACH